MSRALAGAGWSPWPQVGRINFVLSSIITIVVIIIHIMIINHDQSSSINITASIIMHSHTFLGSLYRHLTHLF